MGLSRNNSVTEDGFAVEDDVALWCHSVDNTVVETQPYPQAPIMMELGAHFEDSEVFRKCGICYETPIDGRLLECFHTFCETCLERVWCDATVIRCTLCTRTTSIPPEGINGLPKNPFIRSKPGDEIQLTITCDLCEDGRQAEVHCLDCDQNLCSSCRVIHLKCNASKEHTVQSFESSNIPLPDDLHRPACKKIPSTCVDHGEELSYHCRMCAKAICKFCRKEPVHRGHRTKPLSVVMDTKRKQVSQKMTSIENGYFEVLRKKLYNTRKHAEALSNNIKDVINSILARAEHLKHEIDVASDALISEVLEKEKEGLEKCTSLETLIEQEVLGIGSALQYIHNILQYGSPLEVCDALPTINNILDDYSDRGQTPRLEKTDITFELGDLTPKSIQQGFGSLAVRNKGRFWARSISVGFRGLQDVNIKMQTGFDFPTSSLEEVQEEEELPIHALTTSSTHQNQVWTCAGWNSSTIALLDNQGTPQTSVPIGHKVDDITASTEDELFISCFHKRMLVRYKISTVTMESVHLPYYPRGLTVCNDGSLLICMTDSYSSCASDNSRRFVAKYTKDLKLDSVYEFENNNRLFTRPYRVAENINGDICVTDKTSMGSGRVVVLDRHGKFKFAFEGPSNNQCKGSFSPAGITCDSYGRILVADSNNNCVHILDPNGNFGGFLLQQGDTPTSPHSICIDNHSQFWVGDEEGNIKLYEYL
ncbi:E3 ubiquitin-protein ligase TRIM71-like [Saccostrea cucullata]|uniref:E3 ubiquitin-protein ligase TRIM71-like n=1 Tax=Saccostrea cuccullata TaxID=36930 RepID=UPI002ED27BC6